MMLATLPIAVLLALQPTTPPTSPAPDGAAKDARAARAAELYGQADFAAAALEFEALHRDFPDEPRFLFNAGTTRFAAQHYAQAVLHFNAYIARADVSDSDRRDAQAQLDEARNRVASVQLSVQVPQTSRAVVTLVVRRVARGPADRRPELTFTATPQADVATHIVQLDPGVWAVQVQADGYPSVAHSFEIRDLAPQQFRMSLVPGAGDPARPDGPAAPPRLPPFAVGLIATGSLTTVAGVTVLAAGATQHGQLGECNDELVRCKGRLVQSLGFRDAGAGVFGVGVGALASGLVWLGRDPAVRRKVWIAGSVIGGVVTIGGGVALALTMRRYKAAVMSPDDDWPQFYAGPGSSAGRAASASVLGLGLGLGLGSLASLVIQKRAVAARHALRIDGSASPWLTGVLVSGRF